MKQLFPHWINLRHEKLYREAVLLKDTIQAALPVSIKQISEIHLSLIYTRAMAIGEVRRFVLFMPHEPELPQIWGTCNHSVEIAKGEVRNDFIFFGLTAHQLRFIRRWVRGQYVSSKSS
jgi:hypothetical protein